jgi:hypothetical protein
MTMLNPARQPGAGWATLDEFQLAPGKHNEHAARERVLAAVEPLRLRARPLAELQRAVARAAFTAMAGNQPVVFRVLAEHASLEAAHPRFAFLGRLRQDGGFCVMQKLDSSRLSNGLICHTVEVFIHLSRSSRGGWPTPQ